MKCRNPECGSTLVANAQICVICGTKVATAPGKGAAQSRFVRSIRQSRSNYEEHTEITATDAAISVLAPFVVGQVSGSSQPPLRFPTPRQRVVSPGQLALAVGDSPDEQTVEIESNPAHAASDGAEWARVFESSANGELTLIEADLRGKSKKEQQERFILLFAGAHEDSSCSPPSKEAVIEGAKRSRIYDKNFGAYAGRLGKWVIYAGGTLKLNPEGRNRTREILKEVSDQGVSGFPYWSGSTRSSRSATRVSKEDLALVDGWVHQEVELGKIDVKALGPRHQATVALWLLTVQLKVTEAVKPVVAHTYLTRKFKTIRGTQKGFTDTFSRPENAKRFGRTHQGRYFLSQDGIAEAEALRDGRPAPGKEAGSRK